MINLPMRQPGNNNLPGILALFLICLILLGSCIQKKQNPNLVFVFADQWRAQDIGYMGNTEVRTPNIDELAQESISFTTAVSTFPVCAAYRASLLTGQYPLTHGVFYNDKPLSPDVTSITEVFKDAGYETGYIGKWHVDGHGRSSFIPRERRQGFDFWKVLECTHNYNESYYYGDEDIKLKWDGYDAFEQTKEAAKYIAEHKEGNPFILFLSWGPPHGPYQTAPQEYRDLYKDVDLITLRPNVPADHEANARINISGYYAHIAALDDCMGDLLEAIKENGIEDNTIFVFTSDHGDMLYSHGKRAKQKPWDESIRVPLLLRYPDRLGNQGRVIDMPVGSPDIMPTLLGLAGLEIPKTVEGNDHSQLILGKEDPQEEAALIMCPVPFHQWNYHKGGREYRGVRTRRYTYTEDLKGAWLLYDNQEDPYQLNNLVNLTAYARVQEHLKSILYTKLEERGDKFLPGPEYMTAWEYEWYGNDAPDNR